jgi:glycosyltransferase involved in cell wall biosynthesis
MSTPQRAIAPRPSDRTALKILWVNDLPATRGGCESYVRNTALLLSDRGVRSYLLYDPRHQADPNFLAAFSGAFPGVSLESQVRDLDPDLIYVHRCGDAASLDALSRAGKPVLRFFHDHRLFCLREHKYTALTHRTCTRRTGIGCYACPGFVVRHDDRRIGLRSLRSLAQEQERNKRLSGWVVGSTYMAEHLVDHGFDPSRIHTFPLYAPVPEDRASSTSVESRPPRDPSAIRRETNLFLFVGQLLRGKGLDTLLHALALSHRDSRLVVAGDGPQEEEYRQLARSLKLAGRVHFVGRRTERELADLYLRCTAVVVPSRAPETFGLVGLEAMSHGAPVIASRVGGMNEWLLDGITGLGFDSGDASGLADALSVLSSDPATASGMGAAGRRLHQKRFLPEHHVDRLMDLFHSLTRPTAQAREAAS